MDSVAQKVAARTLVAAYDNAHWKGRVGLLGAAFAKDTAKAVAETAQKMGYQTSGSDYALALKKGRLEVALTLDFMGQAEMLYIVANGSRSGTFRIPPTTPRECALELIKGLKLPKGKSTSFLPKSRATMADLDAIAKAHGYLAAPSYRGRETADGVDVTRTSRAKSPWKGGQFRSVTEAYNAMVEALE
jgi:multisubunit Na+/H+ antiporter MnhC subunit